MKKMHVKRGDTVKVIAGKDKGKEGKIITAIPADGKVIVEGVAVAKRHQKASGIIHKEMPIDASNVMRVCSKCGKAARTGVKVLDDGSKMRYCKKCNAELND